MDLVNVARNVTHYFGWWTLKSFVQSTSVLFPLSVIHAVAVQHEEALIHLRKDNER